MAKKTVKPVEVTEPTPVVKQTCRQMVESHLKRLRVQRQAKADALKSRAEWLVLDLQSAINYIGDGSKRPVNNFFGPRAPEFDRMGVELGMLDQEIEELEAILELAAD
jgi:hypothetical protein